MTCEEYDAKRRDPDGFRTHIEAEEEAALSAQRVRDQYDAAMRRRDMEQRLGTMQQRAREEEASLREVDRSSQPCPGCGMAIQKTVGCDHMRCTQCRYEFCWRCLAE